MKQLILFLFPVIVFSACTKDGEPEPSPTVSDLTTDSTSLNMKNFVGFIDSFSIHHSGKWNITINPSNASWLKLSTSSGKGDTKVFVTTTEANNTNTNRSVKLTVQSESANREIIIDVNQGFARELEAVSNFPGIARSEATSFVIGDKFYIGLGSSVNNDVQQDLDDFYELNVKTRSWKKLGNFPGGARTRALGFSVNGKGYFAGGMQSSCPAAGVPCTTTLQNDFWEYNPINDTWKKVVSFDSPIAQLTGTPSFVINNKAYFIHRAVLWEFDPVNYTFTDRGPTTFVNHLSAPFFVMNNKAYVLTAAGSFIHTSTCYEYDPTINKWTKKGDFPGLGRRASVGFSLNGKGYVVAGEGREPLGPGISQAVALNDIWEYNVDSDTWSKVFELPDAKPTYAVAGVVNDVAVFGTGVWFPGPRRIKDFWLYR